MESFISQTWAVVYVSRPEGSDEVTICFISDRGEIFDELIYPSKQQAEEGLEKNGFFLYHLDENAKRVIEKPKPPFHRVDTPARRVYSSGERWDG
jgi:hypothetical protein